MGATKVTAKIVSQERIATGIYDMVLEAGAVAVNAQAGQFVSLYSKDGSNLLPRPISICEIDKDKGTIRLVYRVVGKGTKEFSHLESGDYVDIMGPLGNGFSKKDKVAILIGGGIGIPPMLELAKELNCEKNIVLGYRDETFLLDDFDGLGEIYMASEDGKTGVKGTVIDALEGYGIRGDIIYACGPTPMLKAVKEFAFAHHMEAQLSLEEKMACGIGACLACVCNSTEVDDHSHVKNKRICKDGPVFDAGEVEL
ncbi:MAG: dihydroorotate dehydrogenase electron transfer subunit [Lachnospiraceae bacterium]|jgi:dihydroorotate dehydrogenase electron transfer subunit|nr:dihydroorotate dehydrogenase electron transfer subunit [Lachnospiraceae bacterium]MCR5702581.1 dihydroorotate dehydrogenase electron transfer subunit [Lachnospiraceae bacterium]